MDPSSCFPENYLSPSPAHGLPGSLFTYCSPLLLALPVPPPRTRDKYAGYVWNASLLLADMVAAREVDVQGKRVLELGAGLGLPGVIAARMGAELVALTDYDEPDMLADTARAVDEALPSALHSRVHVSHTRGARLLTHSSGASTSLRSYARFPAQLTHLQRSLSPSYDLIFLADCVWSPALPAPLVTSLVSLLHACPHAVVHFAAGFHTGRRTVAAFLAAAEAAAIVPLDRGAWREVSVAGETRGWDWHVVDRLAAEEGMKTAQERQERQEERNRWTLYGVLVLQQ